MATAASSNASKAAGNLFSRFSTISGKRELLQLVTPSSSAVSDVDASLSSQAQLSPMGSPSLNHRHLTASTAPRALDQVSSLLVHFHRFHYPEICSHSREILILCRRVNLRDNWNRNNRN